MTRIIDFEKCIGCGLCINDCVTNYIDLNGKKAKFKERGRCINCAHCDSICPSQCIEVYDREKYIDSVQEDNLLNLFSRKRTIRQFDNKKTIDNNILNKVLYAGFSAPTEKNRKSARIVLIKKNLKMLYNLALDYLVDYVNEAGSLNPLYAPTIAMNNKRNIVLWNAEYLVVFVGNNDLLTDSVIAAERMTLAAFHFGLGTAYRGDIKFAFSNSLEIRKILNMNDKENCLIAFCLGYPLVKYLKPAVKINRDVEYM